MKKLTQKQTDMLWGEDGPYSQANLRKEVRILDDEVSRIFLMVDTGEKNASELDTILDTVSDAWNYFPHKFLNGLCPEEILLNYNHKNKSK